MTAPSPLSRSPWLAGLASSAILLAACGDTQPVRPASDAAPAESGAPKAPPAPLADAGPAFTTTASGLRYRVLREGSGHGLAGAAKVTVHYRGWLDGGKEFDASYGGEPFTFAPRLGPGGVIAGWVEAVQHVKVGGKIELEIPSHLGYGAAGAGDIPPHATLHFTMEVITAR